jgi:hypothetical protein
MDLKISQLPETGEVLGTDVIPIVNNGVTKKVSVTQLLDLAVSKDYVDNQDALKVDKVDNERLINATEISKLQGIQAGAEVNVNADWNATSGDALILNKPVIPITTNFVPYTGAISDVNLGEFGIQLGNLEFDLTPTNAPTNVGSLSWNDTDGTLNLKLKGGNTTLQIGQETVARIVNKTATNITLLEANYQVVRVTGAQGQRPKVDLAQANSDLNSTTTLGLVTETILNNEEGFITTSGQVKQINTTGSLQGETWADGDVLYLSGTVAGRITNIKPIAPIHTVIIGFVEYAHAINGKIFVKVDNGYEIEELHNVSAIAPNNNEVLTYDLATTLWKPKTVISALGYTPANANGTLNYISKFTEATSLGNSIVYDNGTSVGIGTLNLNAPETGGVIPNLAIGGGLGSILQLRNTASTTLSGSTLGLIQFVSSSYGEPYAAANIKAVSAQGASGGSSGGANLIFETSTGSTGAPAIERMRLLSNGSLGIGTTSPTYKLQLSTDSAAKPTTALWTIASDARIKENINKYTKGLNELLKINPITYNYNGLGGFEKGKGGVGIIAQEIAEILPDSVSSIKGKLNETDDEEIDILNFNGHELTYVLINAVKELKAEIELLKSKFI